MLPLARLLPLALLSLAHGQQLWSADAAGASALLGSPNQIEAVRAGMEGRPGRFADGE